MKPQHALLKCLREPCSRVNKRWSPPRWQGEIATRRKTRLIESMAPGIPFSAKSCMSDADGAFHAIDANPDLPCHGTISAIARPQPPSPSTDPQPEAKTFAGLRGDRSRNHSVPTWWTARERAPSITPGCRQRLGTCALQIWRLQPARAM